MGNTKIRTIILPLISFLLIMLVLAAVGCTNRNQVNNSPTTGTTGGRGSSEASKTVNMKLGVVGQWAESGHAKVLSIPANEKGCKNCHDGLTFTTSGGGFQPRLGTTNSASTETSGVPRDWAVAIDCRVCHTAAGADFATNGSISGIPNLSNAQGGLGAVCMACHNGWHNAGVGQTGNPAAPHHSVQADVLFGVNSLKVGSNVTSATVGSTASPHTRVTNTCVGCHMVKGSHTFKVNDYSVCQTSGCHNQDMAGGGTAKQDYDGDGQVEKFQVEVDGLLAKLKSAIQKKAGITDFKSERGNVVFTGKKVDVKSSVYPAAYNYFYVLNEGSRGIHNPTYVIQLLQDSLAGVGATGTTTP